MAIVFDEDDEHNPVDNHVLAVLLDPKGDVLKRGQFNVNLTQPQAAH